MAKIKQIIASEILDGRGYPTVEATVILQDEAVGIASAPCGTSISAYEAMPVYDHDEKRFSGFGTTQAIETISSTIAPMLVGKEASHQAEIDTDMIKLDGTQNKSRLGSNAMLAVSMAVAKAAAKSAVLPLFLYLRQFINTSQVSLKIPMPLFVMISGGKHGNSNIDFQELLVIPATSKTYEESLQMAHTIHAAVRTELNNSHFPLFTTSAGAFAPVLPTNREALELLHKAVQNTPFRFGFDIFYGIDAAANTFYHNKEYTLKEKSMRHSANDLIAYYEELNKIYHILYLEDPLAEEDLEGWQSIYEKMSTQTLIVGDDLIATNPYRLQIALTKKAITGMVVKPNQIGTVIEALAAVEVARQSGLKITVSGRSGETNDDFIADFAVAVSADYIKFGGLDRGEHIAKYNRLFAIDRHIHELNSLKG